MDSNNEPPKTPAKKRTPKPRTPKAKSKSNAPPITIVQRLPGDSLDTPVSHTICTDCIGTTDFEEQAIAIVGLAPCEICGRKFSQTNKGTRIAAVEPERFQHALQRVADLEADLQKFVPGSQQTEPKVQTDDTDALASPPIADQDSNKNTGNVPNLSDSVDENTVNSGPVAHAEPGETRGECWERLRKLARTHGFPKGQGPGTAYEWATREVSRLFSAPEPVENDQTAPVPQKTGEETAKAAPVADLGVAGLGEIPESWPSLPANAQLQIEIAWVTANRLRVRSGNGVDLARALSPAPSYSALSWLETSILFPSKFADISVKATADQDDEKEEIRREKLAIEEIRSILKEMLEDRPTQ